LAANGERGLRKWLGGLTEEIAVALSQLGLSSTQALGAQHLAVNPFHIH
jgi:isopentenyl diphosphate isomerase/L-lactate dehydrogenase-like FMN-dependent dehydrogenase